VRPVQSKQFVLLDANVWRYFVDADARDSLRRTSIATKVAVAIAPAVLYEALRTPDAALRAQLVALMTQGVWHRLMPEAYDECVELLEEIRRLRPEWLASKPNDEAFRRLRYDWRREKRGFWDRARNNPEEEAARLLQLESDMLPTARAHAQETRACFGKAGWHFDSVDVRRVTGRQLDATGESVNEESEPWRLASLYYYTVALLRSSGPHHDWLSPMVELDRALLEPGWQRFWLREVEVTRVPRAWIRWACELLFALRRVTHGTPCDTQLATYLVAVTHFVTCDRVFADVVAKCRRSAPVGLAEPFLVPAGHECVEGVLDILKRLADDRRSVKGRIWKSPLGTS
jgi:hypothetical protein